MANTMEPVDGDQSEKTSDMQTETIDMEKLAAKIVELLLRELEIETERAGKFLQGR